MSPSSTEDPSARKVDLKKTLAAYRARAGVFDDVEMPVLRYAMIDGQGDPNTSPAYADAVSTLFSFSYKAKFLSKRELGRDYVVMPLEALWWADDMASFTSARDASQWSWTAMILTPDWLEDDQLHRARAAVETDSAGALRWEELAEGRCVQTLHVGSYDAEGPLLSRLHDEVLPARGLRMTGHHHEIYLNDARRTDPTRLRTILRQPVAPVA